MSFRKGAEGAEVVGAEVVGAEVSKIPFLSHIIVFAIVCNDETLVNWYLSTTLF